MLDTALSRLGSLFVATIGCFTFLIACSDGLPPQPSESVIARPGLAGQPRFTALDQGVEVTWGPAARAETYRFESAVGVGTTEEDRVVLALGHQDWFCVRGVNAAGESPDPSCGTYNELLARGYVRFFEHSFAGLPPTTGGGTAACSHSGLLDGCAWWSFNPDCPSDAVVLSSGTAKVEVAAGTAGGNCDTFAGLHMWDNAIASIGTEYSEVYYKFSFKMGDSSEFELGGMKLWGFFGVGERGRSDASIYFVIENQGPPTGRRGPFEVVFNQQNFMDKRWAQGSSGGGSEAITANVLTPGEWHEVELLMKINTVGSANGTLQVWIDGTKIHDHRDVEFRNAANSYGFFHWKTNGTWAGSSPKPSSEHLYYDDVYMSGR